MFNNTHIKYINNCMFLYIVTYININKSRNEFVCCHAQHWEAMRYEKRRGVQTLGIWLDKRG